MNSQLFLILNAVILLILIIWFFSGRRSSAIKPTQLRMKEGNAPHGKFSPPATPADNSAQKSEAKTSGSRYGDPKYQKFLESDSTPASSPSIKELNVLFNYNGHTWDAYEVLGVAAGENIVTVTKAYQELIQRSSPESQEFFETAFKAILAKK